MRVISGPELDSINCLTDNDVVHVRDAITVERLQNEIWSKGQPRYITNDHWSQAEFHGEKFYCLPLWLLDQLEKFKGLEYGSANTKYTFNFIVNKKQINRFLCIKLVELFKLSNYNYTWSGIGESFDMSKILQELDQLGEYSPLSNEERSFMLSPIQLSKKFFDFHEQIVTDSNVVHYGGNVWTWETQLNQLFLESAVSLITESVQFDPGAIFTEKTAYSVLGLTFPIWVGGYRQADAWNELGFDVFDDVIDHSYQQYPTLIERCYYAFANNIKLLSDFKHASELREKMMPRLEHNRKLLLNDQLFRAVQTKITKWPADLQAVMPGILKNYKNTQGLLTTTELV